MEAQRGRARARRPKARELITPGSEPAPLRESDHGALWDRLGSLDRGFAELKGRVSVILIIDVGTFLALAGLLLAKAF